MIGLNCKIGERVVIDTGLETIIVTVTAVRGCKVLLTADVPGHVTVQLDKTPQSAERSLDRAFSLA